MVSSTSKRWNVLVENYKGEKNVQASSVSILTALQYVLEYQSLVHRPVREVTPEFKQWIIGKIGPTGGFVVVKNPKIDASLDKLAQSFLQPGVDFANWLDEPESDAA